MSVGWVVTDQQETSLREGSHIVEAIRITYKTSTGIVGSIVVPRTDYNPDYVRNAIREAVANHTAVRNLGETAT